jgi:hypothetical protein
MPAQGRAGKAQLSKDANLRRLPDKKIIYFEILSAPFKHHVVSVSDGQCSTSAKQ